MQPNDEQNGLKVLSFDKSEGNSLKPTAYDITRKSNKYHLRVDSCDRGFTISYLMQVKRIDYVPEMLKPMVKPDEIGYITIHSEHVHEPKWIFRLFGLTLERWCMFRIRKLKRLVERNIDFHDRAEALMESLEMEPNAGHC